MAAVKKSLVIEQLRKARMTELLAKGERLDGRGLLDYRPITIEANVIEKANGSARVTIGNTQVIAGAKVEIGQPFPDTPDKGLLVVNSEVLPLASPYAEPGPPDEDAIELSRVVDRGVRESQMIDLSKLCLVEGKKVHALFVDVSVLNVDGNLLDTTSYAVVSSLATAKIPRYEVVDEEVRNTGELIPLPTGTIPISVTMAKIGDAIIVDPTYEEEAVMGARLTITTDHEGNVRAGQKGCPGGFSYEQVMKAAEIAREKGREIRELLKRSIGLA